MKIGIVTAMWQRHDVFKLFAKGINAIQLIVDECENLEIHTYIAGSEGNVSQNLATSLIKNCTYIEHTNQPLASKMNAALALAKDCDFILCVGSDDIIHPSLFFEYVRLARLGYDYIGVTDFYFYDTVSNKSCYWAGYREKYRLGVTCGAGRLLSAKLLISWNWKIWEDSQSHILDNSMEDKLRTSTHRQFTFSLKETNFFALDIKSATNMTPFQLWDNTVYIDTNFIKEKFAYLWN
jgi:glycosyltransferase involved in cell wall biosynthesis